VSYDVQISNAQSLLSIDETAVVQTVRKTLAIEQVAEAEIVVAFVNDETIHQTNREHLGHDYPTDVISFIYDTTASETELSAPRGSGITLDGELVISTETALRESSVYGWSPDDELTLYIVHGLLHLCGYDDLIPEELAIMRQRERDVLQTWNLTPHYLEE